MQTYLLKLVALNLNLNLATEKTRIPGRTGFFSSPLCPDQLWGPHSLVSNRYRAPFAKDNRAGAWSLAAYVNLVPVFKMRGAVPRRLDDGGSKYFWNVGQFLRDYTA
jgi:hypothetical protein